MQPNGEEQGRKLLILVARDGIEPPTPAFGAALSHSGFSPERLRQM
jgi:hypothetical protein